MEKMTAAERYDLLVLYGSSEGMSDDEREAIFGPALLNLETEQEEEDPPLEERPHLEKIDPKYGHRPW